jgi:hypothetical protein
MYFRKRFLPSKKFIIITSSILLVAILLGLYVWKTKKDTELANLAVSQVQVKSLIENDADKDGVRDWEEVLWGTDPANPTSFGKPDKDYVQEKKEKNFNSSSTNAPNDTGVDALAKEFLATIVTLSASGSLTAENIDTIAKKYSAEVGQKKADITNPYTKADIHIGGTESQYHKKLTATLAPYIKKNIGNELVIIQSGFTDDGVFSKGAELAKAGQLYESLAKELLAIPVPATLGELHLAFTNDTAIIGAILLSISEVNTDPISAMVSFSEYSNRSTAFVSGLENIVTKLQQDGIIK